VRDQIARLCIDGTAKFPSFLIPTVEAQLERGGPVACGALALAAWARYLATVPPELQAPDSRGDRSVALAQQALANPLAFLELEEVFTLRYVEATASVTPSRQLPPTSRTAVRSEQSRPCLSRARS
jgi:mannitol-1-phosphate/altronate dehydrogenase